MAIFTEEAPWRQDDVPVDEAGSVSGFIDSTPLLAPQPAFTRVVGSDGERPVEHRRTPTLGYAHAAQLQRLGKTWPCEAVVIFVPCVGAPHVALGARGLGYQLAPTPRRAHRGMPMSSPSTSLSVPASWACRTPLLTRVSVHARASTLVPDSPSCLPVSSSGVAWLRWWPGGHSEQRSHAAGGDGPLHAEHGLGGGGQRARGTLQCCWECQLLRRRHPGQSCRHPHPGKLVGCKMRAAAASGRPTALAVLPGPGGPSSSAGALFGNVVLTRRHTGRGACSASAASRLQTCARFLLVGQADTCTLACSASTYYPRCGSMRSSSLCPLEGTISAPMNRALLG
eukprot:scaffold3181_cov389-Prasinococcus_capsulatus_cf.AAC.5